MRKLLKKFDAYLVLVVVVLTTQPAHAYLDSNSGSMVSQLVLGGMAGWMILGKLFWMRLAGLFRKRQESRSCIQ